MPSNNPPNKHHFVHESYQKGFSINEDNTIFFYKKRFRDIKEKHPASVLYQLGLHTIEIGKEKTVMIETWLSQMEGVFSEFITLLHDAADKPNEFQSVKANVDFVKALKLMVAIQYWRLPRRKGEVKQISTRLLDLYDSASDEVKSLLEYDRKAIRALKKTASSAGSAKVIQFVILPLLSFNAISMPAEVALKRADPDCYFITSDNPVVCDGYEKLFSFTELLFPVSKDLLLVSSSKIMELNTIDINRILFDAATEYVVSPTAEIIRKVEALSEMRMESI